MIASRTVGGDFARRTEREHRSAIEAVVPGEELIALSRQSVAATALTLTIIWLEVVALLVAANLIGLGTAPLTILGTVVVVLLIGTRINAFGVVMHEASHGFLAPDRVLNDRICNAFAAWWLFHSVQEYRPAHRLHHRFLNQARDPDRISSQIPPTKHAAGVADPPGPVRDQRDQEGAGDLVRRGLGGVVRRSTSRPWPARSWRS